MAHETLPYRPCVGIMVVDRNGRIWVGRRAAKGSLPTAAADTLWQMPQGGIDDGEDPAVAALRELEEETGMRSVQILGATDGWLTYDLPAHLIGKVWGGHYRGQRQRWFAVRFLGRDEEIVIDGNGTHSPEFDSWMWIGRDDILDRVVPFKRDVYRAVIDQLGHFATPFVPVSPAGRSVSEDRP